MKKLLFILLILLPFSVNAGSFQLDSTDIDDATIYTQNPTFNYGAQAEFFIGDGYLPGVRTFQTILRFPLLADSMQNHPGVTWDSGKLYICFNDSAYFKDADSMAVSVHKVTVSGWVEGAGYGSAVAGVTWDSASQITNQLDWTNGGDYSATKETFGAYPDTTILRGDTIDVFDTLMFPISGATIADTMANGGLMIIPTGTYWTSAATIFLKMHSSDGPGIEEVWPMLEVFYSEPTDAQIIYINQVSLINYLHSPLGKSNLHGAP